MKIGTWLCFISGHKFIGKSVEADEDGKMWVVIRSLNFCVRCGIARKE